MNLKIDGQALRFRMDGAEYARLPLGERISESLQLGQGSAIQYSVQMGGAGRQPLALAQVQTGAVLTLALEVSPDAYAELASRLPSKEGLQGWCDLAPGVTLELTLDVDVRGPKKEAVR